MSTSHLKKINGSLVDYDPFNKRDPFYALVRLGNSPTKSSIFPSKNYRLGRKCPIIRLCGHWTKYELYDNYELM